MNKSRTRLLYSVSYVQNPTNIHLHLQQHSNNLVLEFRSNIFFACYAILVPQTAKLFLINLIIMDYFRRHNFDHFYGGNFRLYWMSHNKTHHQVTVIEMPSRTRYHLRMCGFETSKIRDFKGSDLPTKPKSKAQKLRDLERRKTFLERKTVCSSLPCSELSDKEFRKLFSRPASHPDLPVAVNNTLVCSLKLAETRIKELQNEMEELKSTNILEHQRHSEEMEQSKETLCFHNFNNELLRLKIADLEQRNKQLQEGFNLVNTACNRLHEDKEQLTTVVQSCLENLDSYKRRTVAGTVISTPYVREPNGSVNYGQNSNGKSDFQQPPSQGEPSCEWCSVVRAFYKVCRPT